MCVYVCVYEFVCVRASVTISNFVAVSVSVYVCVCVRVCVCMHVYEYEYVSVCGGVVSACVYVMYVYVICVYVICVHVKMSDPPRICPCVRTHFKHTFTHTHAHARTCTHTRMHTHTHTHTHKHTHTNIQTHTHFTHSHSYCVWTHVSHHLLSCAHACVYECVRTCMVCMCVCVCVCEGGAAIQRAQGPRHKEQRNHKVRRSLRDRHGHQPLPKKSTGRGCCKDSGWRVKITRVIRVCMPDSTDVSLFGSLLQV